MYFPSLQIMKVSDGDNKINEKLLEQLDFWLASRRVAVRNYLSPYSFSQFSDVDSTLCIDLFYYCTSDKVNILKARYDVFIRSLGLKIGSYYDYNDIPEFFVDSDNNEELEISDNDILIYFELLEEPEEVPNINLDDGAGKPRGVGIVEFRDAEKKYSFAMSDILRKNNL
ncbi:hypothetical protein ACIQYS_09510 [Psychrobacillus sp. NPDC096426]|uniref:hypothetical protein n=1 Tax=Psychrobacillus sp. NPDC096426 TaxID=3364491 RepID=UPI0037F28814